MSGSSKSMCSRHSHEPVTAFCSKHEQTLCIKCLLGAHKDCVHENNVEYISDTAERLEKEIPEAVRTYEHLTTTSKKWSEKYRGTLEALQQTEDKLVTGIKQIQLRIIEQTNKLAADALEIINSVVEDHRSMVQHDLDQLEEFHRKCADIDSIIERCKADEDIVAGEMIYAVNTVKNLHAEFQNTELIERDVKVHFYLSEEIHYMRNKLISFGELCVEDPNCRNTGLRSRPSRVSLSRLFSIDSISDDEIDSSVFVLPKAKPGGMNEKNIYCSIHVEEPPTPCPPPPPLPDMHPDTPIEDKHAFSNNRDKFQTLPRMRFDHHETDVKKSNSFYNEPSKTSPLPIPKLPKKRASLRESTQRDIAEEMNFSDGAKLPADPTCHRPNQFAATADANNTIANGCQSMTSKTQGQDIDHPTEIKVQPSTKTKQLAEMFEKKAIEEPIKLTQNFARSPNSHLKRVPGQIASGSESSVNSIRDSGILIDSDNIPPLPKMHKPRFSLSRRMDSIISNYNGDLFRHSDNVCLPTTTEMTTNSQKSSSLTNLTDAGNKTPSLSSGSSIDTNQAYYSASSNASFLSSESNCDLSISDETFTNNTRQKHIEMRVVPPLDTQSRKSITFNFLFSLPTLNDAPKSSLPSRHSTITGIAVTDSGKLFICDIENHCLQLFDTSGTPLFDYQIREPFSCCTIRDDVIAVTSRDRKTLCIFDISNARIACKREQFISADVDVFGVGYTKGFLGICCLDRVIIITESLQPYRMVKPVVMVEKKRPWLYFVDVKYIAMDRSNLGFFIYTSENKCDRVSCVVVGSRDRPVWNCHVGKPQSVVLSKQNLLVAAKHKIVVIEASSGQRLREIHHDVPTHPVHMVLRDEWLYVSKTSSSNAESRNVRKIPFKTT